MLLTDIALYLENSGLGVRAQNLFAGEIPAHAQDHAIGLLESASAPPEFVHEQNRRIAERPGLQVNVRDADYEVARNKIEAILEALTFRDRIINGVRYLSVVPTGSPISLGRDGNERHLFVCNFDIVKQPS
jgi:hypothetical protein